jgi:hypothetical protein
MNDAVRYDDGMVEVFRHADSLAATVPDDGKRSYLFDLITVLQPNPSGLRRWSVMQKIRKLRQDSDRPVPQNIEQEVERAFLAQCRGANAFKDRNRDPETALFYKPEGRAGEVWALVPRSAAKV